MQLQGKLYKKFDIQNITETFSKREFILLDDSNPSYPQYIKFELFNDKMAIIDNIEPNTEIIVDFNIKGREYQKNGVTNYFNSLVAYSVNIVTKNNNYPENIAQENNISLLKNEDNIANDDDLPF
ncbi:MAG TPA: DUF3127 domain-containing protein [Ignavibacteriales bacterium]|nr:DUF3127 domain-containing protein [Ignavibacteriales bacterium]HOL80571.1 DUF3127 domain-containing protein [Ignavibacteriales bacterium]HOM64261.1 DUF3127 domain-containing protein [Ignavibacteriales bacterium]HPD68558.1 DUF3127 domain-containing protein [Ignavibacteriales bacterium]HPP33093.1 DUF3127 domain-containing protein [Ignavibacteriales bacterium]